MKRFLKLPSLVPDLPELHFTTEEITADLGFYMQVRRAAPQSGDENDPSATPSRKPRRKRRSL